MVSIIIPVYQVSAYIERCIRSVMAQDYPDIECIIVDDASLDDSIDKCERLIGEYDGPVRFIILHHDFNRGLSAARNTGINAATGEYIYFLDSDDEITFDCIKRLMTVAQNHPDAEMIIGNAIWHNLNHDSIRIDDDTPDRFNSNTEAFSAFQRGQLPLTAWNKLIRLSFILQHHLLFSEGLLWEDYPWSFFTFKYVSKLYVCKQVTYHYYLRSGSIVTSSEAKAIGTSLSSSYEQILHNLTEGREGAELGFFVEGFCRRYLEYHATVPAYDTLMKEFKRLSKKYGNLSIRLKLQMTSVLGKIPFGIIILKLMSSLRKWVQKQ